ncbi:MAG: DUF364 domain-containing protein [Coriobacteriia bacterium]|nr:DUF364 domain-containing protein [Coriobacteriia bacterium]
MGADAAPACLSVGGTVAECPGATREPWALYDHLIAGIPRGIRIEHWCLGSRWAYVDAECGMGVSLAVKGGPGAYSLAEQADGLQLHELAAYAKSWNFREASVGIAALNAWHSSPERLAVLGVRLSAERDVGRRDDAFRAYREQIRGRRVAVIGHFPAVGDLADLCELTVLERSPASTSDLPDSACEFLLPRQDFVFITGTAMTNKTIVRLLELSRRATCILVGPSVVPSPVLFDYGVDVAAGSVVVDKARVRRLIEQGAHMLFNDGVQMMQLERQGR